MSIAEHISQQIAKQGWCHLEQVIPLDQLSLMNQFFEQQLHHFRPAAIGSQGVRQRAAGIRSDFTYWLDPLAPPEAFQWPILFLNNLKTELNQQCFLGIKEFECHLAHYPAGAFYQKHLDRFNNDSSRVISFVFYLNQSWSQDLGGELVIYQPEGEMITTISPAPGSLVCFLSHDFPHEVKVSRGERRSFTGWMHTKNIN